MKNFNQNVSLTDTKVEELSLNLQYKDHILCYLQKDDVPLCSHVQKDNFTYLAEKNFDYQFDGSIEFYGYKMPKELEDLDFNILCIVGASGSGKSTFSKYFGNEEQIIWDQNKAIISQFGSENEAIDRLTSVGLNTVPTWLKPRQVLSVGEGFRADLAKRIKDNCVIDEYSSTVDRDVAKSCSVSISRYIRTHNIKRCVFVSCHKDFIDWLCPDYVVDTDDGCVYDTRGLLRRHFELQVFEEQNKRSIWKRFRSHHYLNADMNYTARIFSFRLHDEPIAICAVLPLPSGTVANAWRIHRLVVLPEYQGIGIGKKLLETVCSLLDKDGKIVYMRSSHIKLYKYMKSSPDWQETSSSGKATEPLTIRLGGGKNLDPSVFDRIAYSFVWKGGVKYDVSRYQLFSQKTDINEKQLSLF